MPKTPRIQDRFDDLPVNSSRIGAHRAENPRMRGGVVLLWSAVATVALVAIGIFGTLIATGRITVFPTPSATAAVAPPAEAVVDTTYKVTVLNATPQAGLGTQLGDAIVAAGWATADVTAGEAGSDDFATTTVFYADPADEGAARGLAQVIGGAEVVQTNAYADLLGNGSTKQLVVVIGLDRTTAAAG